jgi:hypothetical protein
MTNIRMMQRENRISRWLVENDPSWERSFDSDLGTLRWTKKGTQIEAVCHPTSMFCEIVGQTNQAGNISDIVGRARTDIHAAAPISGIDDITKYLSSRYLNPGINGRSPFDLKNTSKR